MNKLTKLLLLNYQITESNSIIKIVLLFKLGVIVYSHVGDLII